MPYDGGLSLWSLIMLFLVSFSGLILQDITFVHIGNPEELPDNGGVNFVKCWQYFQILDSMRRFKQQ